MGTQPASPAARYPQRARSGTASSSTAGPPVPRSTRGATRTSSSKTSAAADGAIARSAHGVSDRTRVPLALRDVRSVAVHHAGRHARGAIPAQVAAARQDASSRGGDAVTQIKLYNAGSFFDPRAVPESDYDAIAAGARRAGAGGRRIPSGAGRPPRRTCSLDPRSPGHAARSGDSAVQLEVAMGLETVHPEALERLHKRMTVDRVRRTRRGRLAARASRCASFC